MGACLKKNSQKTQPNQEATNKDFQ